MNPMTKAGESLLREELSRLKNIFDWRAYPEEKKAQWYDYIDEEME